MSLQVESYSRIKKIEVLLDSDGELLGQANGKRLPERLTELTVPEAFIGHAGGLTDGFYRYRDENSFTISYGGYEDFLEDLATLSGFKGWDDAKKSESGPFVELFKFNWSDGVIGHEISSKLAKDFADLQVAANSYKSKRDDFFIDKYENFRDAFDLASDKGAVQFS